MSITIGTPASAADIGTVPAEPLLEVHGLDVSYRVGRQVNQVLHGVSLNVLPGQTTALLGESGSGKSTVVSSIVGTLPRGASSVHGGQIRFTGQDLLQLKSRQLRRLRGVKIGYVPQNPGRSLDPLARVGAQVHEALLVQPTRIRAEDRHRRVHELLGNVGFRDPDTVVRKYPHELSGGMQQRVLIAIAIASGPALLVADEPTSALDVTVQKRILDLLDERRAADGTSILLVTHDIGVAAERSDQVVVLKDGRVVEAGATHSILDHPQHEYTRSLIRNVPRNKPSGRPALPTLNTHEPDAATALDVRDLAVEYRSRHQVVRAVDAASFTVPRGTTLAIVGESGSGKTTTARAIARLLPVAAGAVSVRDRTGAVLDRTDNRTYRRSVQFVYQNPQSSLNPRHSVATTLAEPLRAFGIGDRASRAERVSELLAMVSLPEQLADRRPRQLSGGQQQRVAIARALALEPSLVILDEPVSALDVAVQAQILDLLDRLQRALDLTYLLISHDLSVVRQVSDQVVVLNDGRVVEQGPVEAVFGKPAEPYTRELLAAVPQWQGPEERRAAVTS